MTFDLDAAAAARRESATRLAQDVAAPAAPAIDRDCQVPTTAMTALREALPERPADAPLEWVIGVEALARASVTLALAAAAAALGRPSLIGTAQWAGCRGVDLDGAEAALTATPAWTIAVSAALVGAAASAVDHAVTAMKAAARRDGPTVAVPAISDAAAAVDAARLLLWDAAHRPPDSTAASVASGMARLQALDALTQAIAASEQIVDPAVLRPGAAMERLRRDAVTLAHVAGRGADARAAVAAGTLPG